MATSRRNWKKPQNYELQLPSGNVCLVKRPGMEQLLLSGVLPDSLTPMAMEAIQNAQQGPQDHRKKKSEESEGISPEVMKKFLSSENGLQDIFASFDKVTAACVIEPKVEYHRRKKMKDGVALKDVDGRDQWEDIPANERLSDEVGENLPDGSPNPFYDPDPPLYTDEIDSADKEEIFQFVSGGNTEIAQFPDSGNDVATPHDGASVPVSPVGVPGADQQS